MDAAALLLLDLGEFLDGIIVDADVGLTARTGDAEGDNRLAVVLGDRRDFAEAVTHIGDVGQADGAPIRNADLRARKFERARRIAEHAHGLARTGHFSAAACCVEIDLAQRGVDLRRRDALRLHPHRIERDGDLSVHAAIALDFRHAGDREKTLAHRVVDEPRELLDGHVVGGDGKVGNGVGRGLCLDHLRFEDAFGQIPTHLIDRVLDLVHRGIDVRPDGELDHRLAGPFGRRRTQGIDARDCPDCGFDALGDLVFDFRRRRARLGDGDNDQREFDVRLVLHLHAHERHNPGQREAKEHDDRHDRVADRPGGNVAEVHVRGPRFTSRWAWRRWQRPGARHRPG